MVKICLNENKNHVDIFVNKSNPDKTILRLMQHQITEHPLFYPLKDMNIIVEIQGDCDSESYYHAVNDAYDRLISVRTGFLQKITATISTCSNLVETYDEYRINKISLCVAPCYIPNPTEDMIILVKKYIGGFIISDLGTILLINNPHLNDKDTRMRILDEYNNLYNVIRYYFKPPSAKNATTKI